MVKIGVNCFLAFVISVGGPLQLIPWIRTYAPAFHRWNGRLYIVVAFVTSVAALPATVGSAPDDDNATDLNRDRLLESKRLQHIDT